MTAQVVHIQNHVLPLRAPTAPGESIIWVMRDITTMALYGPSGNMLGHSSFSSMSELVKAVAHYLSVHPNTTVKSVP